MKHTVGCSKVASAINVSLSAVPSVIGSSVEVAGTGGSLIGSICTFSSAMMTAWFLKITKMLEAFGETVQP